MNSIILYFWFSILICLQFWNHLEFLLFLILLISHLNSKEYVILMIPLKLMKHRIFWHSFRGIFITVTLIIFDVILLFLHSVCTFIRCKFKSIFVYVFFTFKIMIIKTMDWWCVCLFIIILVGISLDAVNKSCCYFACSKKCSYFSFTWIWNQLLYQCTTSEKFILTIVSSFWFFVFYIYCLTSRFEKAHSRIINVRIQNSSYNIIYKFECNFFMLRLAEKYFVYLFENSFNYDSYCKDYHWHYKIYKNSFTWKFTFITLLNLCDWNE
jgi:hypothetical protein